MKSKNMRINWLDVAKFFGIFAIFLGHYTNYLGPLYEFLFIFHVPLFFFLSGCSESFNKEISIKKNIIKIIRTLLIPAFIFSFLTILVTSINSFELAIIIHQIKNIIKGCIRKTSGIYGIWFLTCLFIIKVVFSFIRKLDKKWLIAIGIISYIIANFIIKPSPLINPKMYYNLDSALYYFNYFIAGYLLLPFIKSLFKQDKIYKRIILYSYISISCVYAIMLYYGYGLHYLFEINNILLIVDSYIMIFLVIGISYLLKNIKLFQHIGKNTLYLCGNEMIIKSFIVLIINMLGLNLIYNYRTILIVYTLILIIFTTFVIVPIEKPLFNLIMGHKNK